MNRELWIKRRDEWQAQADDASLPLSFRVAALTELFFHYGQDRYNAARAVRQIQDLSNAACRKQNVACTREALGYPSP